MGGSTYGVVALLVVAFSLAAPLEVQADHGDSTTYHGTLDWYERVDIPFNPPAGSVVTFDLIADDWTMMLVSDPEGRLRQVGDSDGWLGSTPYQVFANQAGAWNVQLESVGYGQGADPPYAYSLTISTHVPDHALHVSLAPDQFIGLSGTVKPGVTALYDQLTRGPDGSGVGGARYVHVRIDDEGGTCIGEGVHRREGRNDAAWARYEGVNVHVDGRGPEGGAPPGTTFYSTADQYSALTFHEVYADREGTGLDAWLAWDGPADGASLDAMAGGSATFRDVTEFEANGLGAGAASLVVAHGVQTQMEVGDNAYVHVDATSSGNTSIRVQTPDGETMTLAEEDRSWSSPAPPGTWHMTADSAAPLDGQDTRVLVVELPFAPPATGTPRCDAWTS